MFSFFFFKQKTAYEMRISDWSSDVCSSDLCAAESTFFEQGYLDSLKPRVAKPKAVPKTIKRGPFFSLNKTGGFLKSVAHLRGTRLLVEQLARDLGVVRKKTTSLTPASNHRVPYHFLEVQSAELLRTFGQRQLSKEFVAAD